MFILARKILIDLDVLTLAFWDKKDPTGIVKRISKGEFDMFTPYILFEHLSQWDHKSLAFEIADFYQRFSSSIVTAKNLFERLEELKIDYKAILFELLSKDVKEEDAVLVVVSSVFDIDFLVTYNKRHLKNRQPEINEVLKKNGLKTIRIVSPEEL